MSWWVNLENDNGESLKVSNHAEGGTYCVDGTDEASLNVTYNYSRYYYKHLDKENGLRALDGGTGKDWIERLKNAIKELGTKTSDDYWASTPGNAGHVLEVILVCAKEHPEGIWRVN